MKEKRLKYIIGVLLYILCSYSLLFIFNNGTIILLCKEDGFFETVTAIFFLMAAGFFFISYRKSIQGIITDSSKRSKNVFFLLLGIIFLLGFGEEISWGQRVFDLKTPELLNDVNLQKEINIHNLSIFHGKNVDGQRKSFFELLLNIDRLFAFFWFIYCFIIPIFYKYNNKAAYLLRKINLPIVPIYIGVFFPINYLISLLFNLFIVDRIINHHVVEIKEANFAFLFFIVSILFYTCLKNVTNSKKL